MRHRRWRLGLAGAALAAVVVGGVLLLQHSLAWQGSDRVPPPGHPVPVRMVSDRGPWLDPQSRPVVATTLPALEAREPSAEAAHCAQEQRYQPAACWGRVDPPSGELLVATPWPAPGFYHDWRAAVSGRTLTIRIYTWDSVCEHGANCDPALPATYYLFAVPLDQLPHGPLTVTVDEERGERRSATIDLP